MIATGATGARLLPGGMVEGSSRVYKALCVTTPEGAGALAAAGPVQMPDTVQWGAGGPEYRVAQRCGTDAVVVSYKYGAGEAIWWGSAMPLMNVGLTNDGNLRLVLAALAGRTAGAV